MQDAHSTKPSQQYLTPSSTETFLRTLTMLSCKAKKREDHISDLRETFANLCKHGLKLNPEKCVFGVRRGKLLGCMITERGIEASLVNIEAIRRMQPPATKKGVQKLAGCLASLNKFISRSSEKLLPFFKVLKGSENFHWGPEQDKAFEDLKQYLENLAIMTSPSPETELLFELRSKRSVSRREDGRRHFEAVTNLLRIRSPQQIEVAVL